MRDRLFVQCELVRLGRCAIEGRDLVLPMTRPYLNYLGGVARLRHSLLLTSQLFIYHRVDGPMSRIEFCPDMRDEEGKGKDARDSWKE